MAKLALWRVPIAGLVLLFAAFPLVADGVGAAPAAGAGSVVVNMGPGRDGSQTGTATLTARGAQTEIVLSIQASTTAVPQPAHVHEGGCPGVGPVKHPLTNVIDGKSTTLVDASVAELLSGNYSINVHRSTTEVAVYVSCANLALPSMQSVTLELGPGRDGSQLGSVTLTGKGPQTDIVIAVQPGGAGVSQPAHVHEGGCPGVGAVKFPLTNVVDGKSTTTVGATMNELLGGAYSINVHQSTSEAGVYVSCGNLTLTGPATGPAASPSPSPSPVASPSPSPSPAPPAGAITIKRSVHPQLGTYLTDGAGRTLYVFIPDGLRSSVCVGNCASAWPPIGAAVAGEGASANRIATFTRSDGNPQVAYNGWPLYYYRNDPNPGDISGHGRNAAGGFWFAVSPYSGPRFVQAIVTTMSAPGLGTVLTDPSGRPLYLATNDEPNKTNCFGNLAERWPPLLTAAPPVTGGSARADLLGTIQREEGSTQVTYNGWPLYYFNNDVTMGTVAGQGITDGCGAWWVLNAAGQSVETRAPTVLPATGTGGLASEEAPASTLPAALAGLAAVLLLGGLALRARARTVAG